MAEFQLAGGYVVSGGAVIEQQWGVDRHNIPEAPRHGHAAAGVDGEGPTVGDKIPDGFQIPLRNGGIRRGQSAVIVNGE